MFEGIIGFIGLVLGVVFVFKYFKELKTDERKQHIQLAKRSVVIGSGALIKVSKDAVELTAEAATGSSRWVELHGMQAMEEANSKLDTYVAANGGTDMKAAINTGDKIADFLYIKEAKESTNKWSKSLKDELLDINR